MTGAYIDTVAVQLPNLEFYISPWPNPYRFRDECQW